MSLSRLSTFFKTDLEYLVRGSFWLNLATVLSTVCGLILTYSFGNYVTPEVYGEYRYFLSLYGILILAAFGGFNSVVVRATAQGKEGELLRCFKIQTLGALLGTLGSIVIAAYYYLHSNNTLAYGLLVLGFSLPLMESLDLYAGFLNGKKLFRESAIAGIVSQLFATIALLIAMYLHERVLPLLITYFVSWIAIKGFFFVMVAKKHKPNNLLAEDTYKNGFHLSALNVLNHVANQLDRIALFQFIGAREVALYSFAIAPAEQIKGLFKNANALIFPKFTLRTEAELRESIPHKMVLIGGAALVAATAYTLAAPFIIGWFLPKYIEIIPASQIFAFSLVGVMVIPLNVAMNSIPKIRALYLTNIISPIINIVLIVTLIPLYGFWGAIAAKSIGRITTTLVTYIVFVRS